MFSSTFTRPVKSRFVDVFSFIPQDVCVFQPIVDGISG